MRRSVLKIKKKREREAVVKLGEKRLNLVRKKRLSIYGRASSGLLLACELNT